MRKLLFILLGLLCHAYGAWAVEVDYTDLVAEAACNTGECINYWTVERDGSYGALVWDNWSSRGGKDGSNMTNPFLEYRDGGNSLSDARLMHQVVTGLPAGRYRVTGFARIYNEVDTSIEDLSGVSFVAGSQSLELFTGEPSRYNGQPFEAEEFELECQVGADGTLSFGFVFKDANCNWLAAKDFTLTHVDGVAGERDEPTPGGDDPEIGKEGSYPSTKAPDALKAGTYYLRNVYTGKYLYAAGNGGVQAMLGAHAVPVKVNKVGGNNFLMDAGYSNNGSSVGISDGIITVTGSATTWTIEPNVSGYYTISSSGEYIGYDGKNEAVYTGLTNAYSKYAQWQLLTKAEMLKEMVDNKQKDATFLIANPRMDRYYVNSEGWTGACTLGGDTDNYNMESWNSGSFDCYQVLTNIPNGKYTLTCQGYYRYNEVSGGGWWGGSSSNTNANSSKGGSYAYLYGNSTTQELMKIEDELGNLVAYGTSTDAANMPFSQSDCSKNFSAGLYADNELTVTVTDHTLRIGLKKTEQHGCDWTVWDNFELTLLSLGNNTDYDPEGPSIDPGDLSDASWNHPVDVTSYVQNADFSSGKTSWSGSGSAGSGVAYRSYADFDLYQSLTNMPKGLYRLKAQGFYRFGDVSYEQQYSYDYSNQECVANKVYAMYTIPYATISRQWGIERERAFLYANDYQVAFPSIFDDAYDNSPYSGFTSTELGYVPGNEGAASWAFGQGNYKMEVVFPVMDGSIRLGAKKTGGYKNDWAVWDNIQLEYLGTDSLVYAESVSINEGNISVSAGETKQLSATLLPTNTSAQAITWTVADKSIATVSTKGVVTGVKAGTTEVYAYASENAEGESPMAKITVTVAGYGTPTATTLKINEIMVANIDMFVDPSKNYGGYVELYNSSTSSIKMSDLKISIDGGVTIYQLSSSNGVIPAKGCGVIWFDHHDAKSSQIDAKLDMEGGNVTIYNTSGTVLASQDYPAAIARTSYARSNDGVGAWCITAYPTPGESNSKAKDYVHAEGYERFAEPEVSHESQLFNSPFSMTVTIPRGAKLYYTTDGSTPSTTNGEQSTDGKFDISETTILRLRLMANGYLPSPVKTLSYIKNDKDYMLPVLSVVGDPVNFYDDELGVLVPGTAGRSGHGVNYPCNWTMAWERPVAFNYFTLDGKTNYSQETDMERCGGWSRSWYPFSFKLKANSQYEGRNFIEQQIFPDKPYLKEKVWQVRNGGNDLLCRIKDASLVHLATSCGFYLDCQDYKSVHSFINGKYQGMLNIREPNNKHYGYANYGYDTDYMDAGELGGGYSAKTGDSNAWSQLYNLANSFSGDEAQLEEIGKLLDLDEFINYMAAQLYLGGDDWPGNNCKAFRSKEDGKYHFVFFDVDQALRYDATSLTRMNSNGNQFVTVFRRLVNKNETMRRRFIDTYSIVAGSVYEPARVDSVITAMAEEMEPALALEGNEPWTTANNTIRVLGSTTRQQTMMNALLRMNDLKLSDYPQRAVLNSNVQGARMQLNGIDIPTGYLDGYVFYPAEITVSAPEGYIFKGWVDEDGNVVTTDATYEMEPDMDIYLTATYERAKTDEQLMANIAMPLKVNEVSADNTIFINENFKRSDWFEIYNNADVDIDVAGLFVSDDADEPLKYQIPSSTGLTNTIIPARGHMVIWADKLQATTQIHSGFKLSNTDGSVVLLTSSDQFVANNPAYFNAHPGMKNFVDGMTYTTHTGEETVGRYPDGGKDFYLMKRPSIERKNICLVSDEKVGEDINMMPSYSDFFEYYLAEGWNWMSHNLDASIVFGQLPVAATKVLSAKKQAVKGSTNVWSGTLSNMDAGKMYKVLTSAATTMHIDGDPCDSSAPLTLNAGWNWLGYPVSGTQTLSAALRNFTPEVGDIILSQDGFSLYTAEGAADGQPRWVGTVSSFETGKGYLYNSQSGGYVTFAAPLNNVKVNKSRLRRAKEAKFGYDKNAYPNVMGFVAQMKLDGETITDDRFDLLAYADSECRGAAKWVDNLLFLNSYGEGGEKVTFRAVDNLDGTVYNVEENYAFSSGVQGTVGSPVVLTLTSEYDPTGISSPADMAAQNHGTVLGYYSLSGVYVARRSSTLNEGIYIIKYSDGTHSKVYVK